MKTNKIELCLPFCIVSIIAKRKPKSNTTLVENRAF